MRVTFVRHGESQANSAGRWQGQGDSPLSDHGRKQAARAAARLGKHAFTRVVASDLSRARDTGRALGLEPDLDPGLREIHVGAWEGLERAEVLERFPDEIAALVRGDDVKIGGGESWREATVRAMAALRVHLAAMNDGDELAVFSHGGVITSTFMELTGAATRRPPVLGHMVNTAISVARFDAQGAVIERYNDAVHVPETAPWRRRMFGETDTLVGYLVAEPTTAVESFLSARGFFEEVDVVSWTDPSLNEIATGLAAWLEVPHEDGPTPSDVHAIADRHPGRRVIVVSSAEQAGSAIRDAMRETVPKARFGELPPSTLSHIARTRSTTLLVDFAARLVDP